MILPVIMAGGSGTRLWPLSRSNYPKQFLALNGKKTMLQQTLLRLSGIDHQPCMIICNEEHRFIAAEQVRELGTAHSGIFLEPSGRNTAPAIALAALKAVEENQDAVLLVLAADHVINGTETFQNAIELALVQAQNNKMVTFGIVADSPETGFGYIRRGDPLDVSNLKNKQTTYNVSSFVEKPSLEVATQYVASGEYYWNSGMFMFKASRYLDILNNYNPEVYQACKNAMKVRDTDMDFVRVDKAEFLACPSISIDYAVMEPLCQDVTMDDAVVVPLDAGWSDVGGYKALWQISEQDDDGNVLSGDVKTINTKNTLVKSEDKMMAVIGVDNMVIINTKDVVLVAHKDNVQEVTKIVDLLKAEDRPEVVNHREVYRPWGKYDAIDVGARFQVKRITVKPGEKLSIQMHHHRAEHWVVVTGTAKVTNGDDERLLTENQSIYIPIGVTHSLENPGKVNLELIEIQTGSYLGEDDIVRFEDRYGRN